MKYVNQQGRIIPIDPATGKYLLHGNGCKFFPNCFECPERPEKCHYESRLKEDGDVLNRRDNPKLINLCRSPES
jgi:hypothetical protein